jgi:putative MATE family efflux protein
MTPDKADVTAASAGSLESAVEPVAVSGYRGRDLTTGSIWRHLVAFSVPMLIGSAMQNAYSLVNAIWVGKGIGSDALAVVTVSFPIFFVLMAAAGGLTQAASILVAQRFGAKDLPGMKRIINNSVTLTAVASISCAGIGHLLSERLLILMKTPPEIIDAAVKYQNIYLWTIPFTFGLFLISSVLRGVGDSKTPLLFQAVALAGAAILDPFLIFGWLGLPKLGLNGTAWATILAQGGALLALVWYLEHKQHIARPDYGDLRPDWQSTKLSIQIGIPSMIQQAQISLGMIVLMSLVNGFGKDAAAAFGAAMRIDQFAFMPAMTIGMAVTTLAGQNIGAGRFDRVKESFWWGVAVSAGFTLLATIPAVFFPHWILHIFVDEGPVMKYGCEYLQIVGPGYLVFAVWFTGVGVINGAGDTMATTLISIVNLWLVRLPLAAHLSSMLQNIKGIWYAMIFSFACGMLCSLVYFFSGCWKRKVPTFKSPALLE